jgi:protein TonB
MPVMISRGEVVYPDSARKVGLEGSVWVKSLVDTSGSVVRVLVQRSSGHKILDDAALTAAKKCRFKPATSGDQKIAIWITYETKFKLK